MAYSRPKFAAALELKVGSFDPKAEGSPAFA